MAHVGLATLPQMIRVQTDPATIDLSPAPIVPGARRASQGRRRRLDERAPRSDTLKVVHQALWGASLDAIRAIQRR